MKDKDIELSVGELETLCNLYIECKLTVLEETELYYVLIKTDKDSALINETKAIMGMERKIADSKPIIISKKPFYKRFAFYVAAACLALVIALSVPLFFNNRSDKNNPDNIASTQIECVVYSNGKRISGDKAISIAQANIDKMNDFEKKMQLHIDSEQDKVESFMSKTREPK